MFDAYVKMLQNYVVFEGRCRRREYWLAFLMNFLIGAVLGILSVRMPLIKFLSGVYSLGVLIPMIALAVRRLHDIGKSGVWILISLIPLVGEIILIVFLATDSVPDNQYGPNPKTVPPAAV